MKAVRPLICFPQEPVSLSHRVGFTRHYDLFAVPFDEIAPIVGRSPTAARQIASRARRRVQGTTMVKFENTQMQDEQRREPEDA